MCFLYKHQSIPLKLLQIL